MTPEAQRIAIAEACGWINQGKAKRMIALMHRWRDPKDGVFTSELPDYLSDLNAMHEAEEVVIYTRSLGLIYLMKLQDAANHSFPARFDNTERTLPCTSATAAQRAEAFLRTIGKWEDSP